jgi:hypothetical protein
MVHTLRNRKPVNYNVAKILQKSCREIHAARKQKRSESAKYKTYCKRLQMGKKMTSAGVTKKQKILLGTLKKDLNTFFGSAGVVTLDDFHHDLNRVVGRCYKYSAEQWKKHNMKYDDFYFTEHMEQLPIDGKIGFIRKTINIMKALA